MVENSFAKCMANDDCSEAPRRMSSKNRIFIFSRRFFLGGGVSEVLCATNLRPAAGLSRQVKSAAGRLYNSPRRREGRGWWQDTATGPHRGSSSHGISSNPAPKAAEAQPAHSHTCSPSPAGGDTPPAPPRRPPPNGVTLRGPSRLLGPPLRARATYAPGLPTMPPQAHDPPEQQREHLRPRACWGLFA